MPSAAVVRRQATLVAKAEQRVDRREVPVPEEHAQYRTAVRPTQQTALADPPRNERLVHGQDDARDGAAAQKQELAHAGRHLEEPRACRNTRPQLAQGRQRRLHEQLRLARQDRHELAGTRVQDNRCRPEQRAEDEEVGPV